MSHPWCMKTPPEHFYQNWTNPKTYVTNWDTSTRLLIPIYCKNDMVKKKHVVVNNNTFYRKHPNHRIPVGFVSDAWFQGHKCVTYGHIVRGNGSDSLASLPSREWIPQIRPYPQIAGFHFKVERSRSWDFKFAFNDWPIDIMLNFLPNSTDSEMWASVLSAPSGKNYAMEPHSLDVCLQNGIISS